MADKTYRLKIYYANGYTCSCCRQRWDREDDYESREAALDYLLQEKARCHREEDENITGYELEIIEVVDFLGTKDLDYALKMHREQKKVERRKANFGKVVKQAMTPKPMSLTGE